MDRSGLSFSDWLDYTESRYLVLCSDEGMFKVPYVTRFSDIYQRRLRRRLFDLGRSVSMKYSDVSFLTFTSLHDGSVSDCVCRMKDSWRRLRMVLSRRGFSFDYFYVFEPHSSGYPHMHVLVFGKLSRYFVRLIRRFWVGVYGMGSMRYGFHCYTGLVSSFGLYKYLVKYLVKLSNRSVWSSGDWSFYSVMWSCGYRLYSMSRGLSMLLSGSVSGVKRSIGRVCAVFSCSKYGVSLLYSDFYYIFCVLPDGYWSRVVSYFYGLGYVLRLRYSKGLNKKGLYSSNISGVDVYRRL